MPRLNTASHSDTCWALEDTLRGLVFRVPVLRRAPEITHHTDDVHFPRRVKARVVEVRKRPYGRRKMARVAHGASKVVREVCRVCVGRGRAVDLDMYKINDNVEVLSNPVSGNTLSQNVPRALRRESSAPSISSSFAPGLTLTFTVPIKSSVREPSSLSITVTTRSAIVGTFFTRQTSFHTGSRVFCFTDDLHISREYDVILNS